MVQSSRFKVLVTEGIHSEVSLSGFHQALRTSSSIHPYAPGVGRNSTGFFGLNIEYPINPPSIANNG